MKMATKLLVLTAAVTAAGGMLAACSGSSTSSGASTGGASASSGDAWYASVKTCDLLNQSQLKSLGFSSSGAEGENDANENGCTWDENGWSNLGIMLSSKSFDSLDGQGSQVTDVTIAGRPGKIAQGTMGSCELTMKATDGSQARIIVAYMDNMQGGNMSGMSAMSMDDSSAKACSVAKQAAQNIAPKLPSL